MLCTEDVFELLYWVSTCKDCRKQSHLLIELRSWSFAGWFGAWSVTTGSLRVSLQPWKCINLVFDAPFSYSPIGHLLIVYEGDTQGLVKLVFVLFVVLALAAAHCGVQCGPCRKESGWFTQCLNHPFLFMWDGEDHGKSLLTLREEIEQARKRVAYKLFAETGMRMHADLVWLFSN